MTHRAAPRTYLGIQALRGVAAVMVMLVHVTGGFRFSFAPPQSPHFFMNGAAGVDVFFVISGFVMAVTALGERRPTPGNFLSRRLLRIVPLYWLVTLLTAAKMLLVALHPSLGSDVTHMQLTLPYLWACLFFLPVYSSNHIIEPVVAAGWTLNYEMFFYLIFAATLFFRRRPLAFLIPVLLLLGCIGLVHQRATPLYPGWPAFTTLVGTLLLEFLAGLLLGRLAQSTFTLNAKAAILAGLLGLTGLLTLPVNESPGIREAGWGASAFLLVLAAVMLERSYGSRVPRWMLAIGDASYSLYLTHNLVLLTVVRILLRLHASPNLLVFIGINSTASIVTALLVFRFIERPVTIALGRLAGVTPPISVVGTTDGPLHSSSAGNKR